jgi:hypothetical protein
MSADSPMTLLSEIDRMYSESKKARHSRLSLEWGIWSGEMNRAIRKRIAENDPEKEKLKLVFVYWQNASILLELHFKSKILRRKKKKECREIMEHLKKQILA